MNLLITSATSELGRVLADALAVEHHVLRCDRQVAGGEMGIALAGLGSDLSTNLLTRGIEVIVHVGEPLDGEDDVSYFDAMTRGTYNLLWAATQEGVRRIVYLSTLDLMAAYDEELIVTERWRTRPAPKMPMLGKAMGESVCREFAREHKLEVMVLRLGQLVMGDNDAGNMSLERDHLIAAVRAALDAPAPLWTVLHVQSQGPGARFPAGDARRLLNIDLAAGSAHQKAVAG